MRSLEGVKFWALFGSCVDAESSSIITYNTRDFAGVEQFGLSLLEPSEFLRLIGKLP